VIGAEATVGSGACFVAHTADESAIYLKPCDNFPATEVVVGPTVTSMGEYRATRVPIDLPAWLQIEARAIQCRITNISLGGVFVTGAMLVADTPLSIRFTPPRCGELLAACTARWSCEDGVGLRFERLAAGEVDQLAWVIRDVLMRMA